MITSTRKIVFGLHDQAEDEESKSHYTLRNMTKVLHIYINIRYQEKYVKKLATSLTFRDFLFIRMLVFLRTFLDTLYCFKVWIMLAIEDLYIYIYISRVLTIMTLTTVPKRLGGRS